MSERLKGMLKDRLLQLGENSEAKLSVAAGVSQSLIRTVLKAGHLPLPANARKLALACGASEADALEIAKECDRERAKETA